MRKGKRRKEKEREGKRRKVKDIIEGFNLAGWRSSFTSNPRGPLGPRLESFLDAVDTRHSRFQRSDSRHMT